MLNYNQKIICKLEAFATFVCSLLSRQTNAQRIHINNIFILVYLKYSFMFRCTSLITFPWPYVFYTNSLQDHTHKTVQTVYTATKQRVSMCYNYNSWQIITFYRLYFNINCNGNILIYWFYWVCSFNDFCNLRKVEE